MAHHAVTRNGDSQRVGATRLRHGADGFGLTELPRDLRIACGRAGGDLAQRPPDALLERRPTHVQRKIEANTRRFDKAHDFGNPLLEPGVTASDEHRIAAFVEVIFSFPFLPAFKAIKAAQTNDAAWRALRPPLFPLMEAERESLFDALSEAGFGVVREHAQ